MAPKTRTTAPEDQADEQAAPVAFDPLAVLTIAELDSGSRLLKASLVSAIMERSQDYERALAVVAFLHGRRTDPAAKLSTWTAMTYVELNAALAQLAPDAGDDDGADPTAPGSA